MRRLHGSVTVAQPGTETVDAALAITVRPFEPRDADAVAAALVDSSIHHVGLEPERYEALDPETVAARYRRGDQHPGDVVTAERATFVAELDGAVVGVVDVRVVRPEGAHRPYRYGYVPELAVAARARRRGVGARLLAAAEDWARRTDCAYTVLDYNVRNVDAARFYLEQQGYRPAGMIVVKDLRGDESR